MGARKKATGGGIQGEGHETGRIAGKGDSSTISVYFVCVSICFLWRTGDDVALGKSTAEN
jgi:hypothetical protein